MLKNVALFLMPSLKKTKRGQFNHNYDEFVLCKERGKLDIHHYNNEYLRGLQL